MKFIIYSFLSKVFSMINNISWKFKYLSYREKYNLSEKFRFNGSNINFYGEGEIHIDENTYIGEYSRIQAYDKCKVIIGKNCAISHYVKIYTMNRNPNDIISERNEISKKFGDVKIGDNCWIGVNVFITEGVNIGNNTVVGANSIVTRDIPSNCIYAGTKIIKTINSHES